MAIYISRNPAETARLGEKWGRDAESGLVLGLCGDLGAGKTQLVKGLARGLGINVRVHSPTFALVNMYTGGRLPLFHLDLYRLETREQIVAAGLEEYLKPDGVTVIEWVERLVNPQQTGNEGQRLELPDLPSFRAAKGIPKGFRWVRLEVLSEIERRIVYEDSSA
jgi:tRNA threonylcarbamoyladenosine biosynthesis protein TsaE